jgi:capsular polysaccharide transport system permease protein
MAETPEPTEKPWQAKAPSPAQPQPPAEPAQTQLPAERPIVGGRAERQADKHKNQRAIQAMGVDSPTARDFDAAPAAPAPPYGFGRQLEALLATRRAKLRQFIWRIGLFIILPSILVWFYTAVIATPAYQCSYQITYQSYQPSTTLASNLRQTSFGATSNSSIDYGTLISLYISSSQLAEQIDKQMNLRQYYSSRHIDWFSRLHPHATQAQLLKFWNSNVQASEGFGGYITVTVTGYDPQFTLALSQNIFNAANEMMAKLTADADAVEVQGATRELLQANVQLQDANDKLTSFRNAHGDFDVNSMASELDTIIGSLESQVANLRAQLDQAQANMQPNASQIVQLKLQISGLESQIATEAQRLAAQDNNASYSNLVTQYQSLLSNQALASTDYSAAQQGLIVAQAQAAQKQNYVVAFVPPYLPDKPNEPRPFYDMFVTLLGCICVYGIGNLVFSAFRDQAGI